MSTLVDDLAAAITEFESGGNPNALNYRNNNPGNLRSWGNYPVVNGYVVFPDWQTGWNALIQQITLNISRGLSLNTFFAGQPGVYGGYAPSSDSNQPATYAATVAGWLGIDPNTPLVAVQSSYSPPDPPRVPRPMPLARAPISSTRPPRSPRG